MPIVSSNSGRFATCLLHILKYEGGWSDHAADPGGATMKGITLATYSDWLKRPATKAELKAIPDAHLHAIYEQNYFRAAHCHELPAGVDLIVFDLAVNSGVGRARKYLQRAAGVTDDGIIGPATLAAVKARKPLQLVDSISGLRDAFYRGLPTFQTFGKGWLRRLSEVTAKAREMAA